MEYAIFVGLLISLYCFVIFYKRQQDKQGGILYIEEYEHLIVFRDDEIRHNIFGAIILGIASRGRNAEKVKVKNAEIYNLILKFADININKE